MDTVMVLKIPKVVSPTSPVFKNEEKVIVGRMPNDTGGQARPLAKPLLESSDIPEQV